MPTLRDGTVTRDPRLDRIPQWDVRNEDYPVRALLSPRQLAAPRSFTWRCAARLDQGSQGACVSFGWAHELMARPVVVPFTSTDAAEQFAREQYWEMQKIDPWPGGSYPGGSPVYEGTSVLAGAQVHQALGYIDEYRWALDLEDLIVAVGYKGPAVIGVDWFTGMLDTDANGWIKPTGVIEGGHCVILRKVSVPGRYFGGVNSWGESWGVNGLEGTGGCFRISWEDMGLLLSQNGEACIPVRRSQAG